VGKIRERKREIKDKKEKEKNPILDPCVNLTVDIVSQ